MEKMDRSCMIVKLCDGYSFDSDIQDLIKHFKLVHGDIIADQEEDRFVFARILVYDETNENFKLIENPDDSGSGYITIPSEVLSTIKDFQKRYADVIKDAPFINFYISNDDAFVRDKFGSNNLDGYKFDVHYTWGDLDGFYVRKGPQAEWKDFPYRDVTMEQMEEYFTGAKKQR